MAEPNGERIDAEAAPMKEDEKEEKPDLFEDIPEDIRNDSIDSVKTRSRMIDNEIRVSCLRVSYTHSSHSFRCSNQSSFVSVMI